MLVPTHIDEFQLDILNDRMKNKIQYESKTEEWKRFSFKAFNVLQKMQLHP